MRCWVIFTNDVDHWLARLLKPGFRHCFVLAHMDTGWFYLDLATNYLDIQIVPVPADFPYADWLEEQGLTLAESERRYKGRIEIGIYTCVSMAKQFIGISNPLILTPHQLYRHLTKSVDTTDATR